MVRAVAENRYGVFPVVRLLDFHQARIPEEDEMTALPEQSPPPGRGGAWLAKSTVGATMTSPTTGSLSPGTCLRFPRLNRNSCEEP